MDGDLRRRVGRAVVKERPILFSARGVAVAAARLRVSVAEYRSALKRGEKLCGGCRLSRPRNIEFFGTETKQPDGLRSRCRDCVSAAKKARYRRVRVAERARQLRYQRDNRARLYAYNAAWQRRRNAALRREALAAYGGACACCGETEPIFLDFDHIHNDGAADRRRAGNQVQVVLELKANGWPRDRIQLLCCNCNQGKARNGGVCPHVARRSNAA